MKRWPLHTAYFWESAPFFRVLLPFACGIAGYELTRPYFVARISSAVFLLIAFIAYVIITYVQKRKSYLPAPGFLLVSSIFFSGGYALSLYDDVRNDKQDISRCVNNGAAHLARITGTPAEREKTWKIPVRLLNTIDSGGVNTVTGKAFVYVHKSGYPLRLQKGDSIIVPGNWQPIKAAGNPFEFDYATYCRRNGITRQQFCNRGDIVTYSRINPGANTYTERMHDWCMAQLDKYIPDTKARGLMQAMLLGDEVNLDEDLRDAYAATGIIHIIAISGGNVAIFFIVISFLLRWLKHKKHLWVRYAIALPLVWFYVVMAGSSPSAIRAAVMFSLLAVGVMLQKNNNSLNQLFATAFVLLCTEPMWLFAVGFQLSFVAVLSIILFYGPIYKWLSPKYLLTKALWSTAAASLAAEILIAPLVIYYFHNFPVMFIIANVAAYIFMSVVLILGMGVIVLSFVPAMATLLGWCIGGLVDMFGSMVSWLQQFSPPSFQFLVLTGAELVLAYACISGFLTFIMRKQKSALFTGLSMSIMLLAFLCYDQWSSLRQQRLVVYNIGSINRIERIEGKRYSVLSPDTGNIKKIAYATTAAHTHWRAWRKGNDTGEVFVVNGKTVLVLNREIFGTGTFPADYVIINYTGYADPAVLKKVFSPAGIIMGNNYTKRQQEKFVAACANVSLPVHSIANNGAFVVN